MQIKRYIHTYVYKYTHINMYTVFEHAQLLSAVRVEYCGTILHHCWDHRSMVLFCFFYWKKSSKNHLRPASGQGSGLPRQRKVRPPAVAVDLQPRTKSFDTLAMRVITGTSHWTVLLFLHCWLASAGGLGCGRATALYCVVPVSSISDDLFSGMCRGNGKPGSGVGA